MFYVPFVDSTNDNESTDGETGTSSITEKDYEAEWAAIIYERNLNKVKNQVLSGNLRQTHIRSVYWRVLLEILPLPASPEWAERARKIRSSYAEIKSNFTSNPYGSSPVPDDNPLSQDENSLWRRYFCDKELKRIIKQDVGRTFPEKVFFQAPSIQELMINVLFVYARKNPDICYRQGMHEILAPILLVFHEDYQTFKLMKQTAVINSLLFEIMDLDYLEEDVFDTFSCIMSYMSRYYRTNCVVPTADGHLSLPDLPSEQMSLLQENNESPICSYLNSIRDNTLVHHDRELYNHLKELNIPFTVFGIRWLRLLFGREFPLKDLLTLWDAVFAIHSDFALVGYVLISMLIMIRNQLLNSDYTDCLNCLMKYPNSIDVSDVINYSIFLKDPTLHQKLNLPIVNGIKNNYTSKDSDSARKPYLKNYTSNRASITKKFKNLNPVRKNTKGINSTSFEQYSPNKFKMVISELERTRAVMSICKLKLGQYHEILANYISSDDMKAQQALTGIQELCSLLDTDPFSLKSSSNLDVEIAREAGEVQLPVSENMSLLTRATSDAIASYLPPPKSDIDMTIFKQTEFETTDFSRFPAENPLKLHQT